MTWVDSLRDASFRGIAFKVDTAELGIGRRKVIHEFPFQDTPYSEDLGKKARSIRLRAYFIGENAIQDSEELILSIETEKTPGTLIHPTRGSMTVVPGDCTDYFTKDEGNIVYLDLSFTEAGENKYPDALSDTKINVENTASTAIESIKSVFVNEFSTSDLPGFVSDDARSILGDFVDQVKGSIKKKTSTPEETTQLKNDLSSFEDDIPTLVGSASDLADQVDTLVGQVNGIYTDPNDAYLTFKDMLGFGDSFPVINETTTTRRQQAANQRALVKLYKRCALVGMCLSMTEIEFDSYEDASDKRDELADLLDVELIDIGDTDEDKAYIDLDNMRAAMVKDATQRAASLRRINYLNPIKCLPALVTAYDVYKDATFDAEIAARNKVRHPGFLPANQPLQVLI